MILRNIKYIIQIITQLSLVVDDLDFFNYPLHAPNHLEIISSNPNFLIALHEYDHLLGTGRNPLFIFTIIFFGLSSIRRENLAEFYDFSRHYDEYSYQNISRFFSEVYMLQHQGKLNLEECLLLLEKIYSAKCELHIVSSNSVSSSSSTNSSSTAGSEISSNSDLDTISTISDNEDTSTLENTLFNSSSPPIPAVVSFQETSSAVSLENDELESNELESNDQFSCNIYDIYFRTPSLKNMLSSREDVLENIINLINTHDLTSCLEICGLLETHSGLLRVLIILCGLKINKNEISYLLNRQNINRDLQDVLVILEQILNNDCHVYSYMLTKWAEDYSHLPGLNLPNGLLKIDSAIEEIAVEQNPVLHGISPSNMFLQIVSIGMSCYGYPLLVNPTLVIGHSLVRY